jgi:hypothetical protein
MKNLPLKAVPRGSAHGVDEKITSNTSGLLERNLRSS